MVWHQEETSCTPKRLVTRSRVDPQCRACRPLLHAVVGGYAAHAWGVEIDRIKCDKGNAFMRYAAADMAKRNTAWGAFAVPAIRCAPIEDVRTTYLLWL